MVPDKIIFQEVFINMLKLSSINIWVLGFLVLFPGIQKVDAQFSMGLTYLDELISFLILVLYLRQITYNRNRITHVIYIPVAFILYSLFLIFYRELPYRNILQVLIYLKVFFYFLYFNSLSDKIKKETLDKFCLLLNLILIAAIIFSFFEITFPSLYSDLFGFEKQERGINDFYLTSFFGHRTSLSHFIIIYVVFWYYKHYCGNISVTKKQFVLLILAMIFLFFSFSRKEFLFVIIFITFFPYSKGISLWLKRIIVLIMFMTVSYYYFNAFFIQSNENTFTENYNRLIMTNYAVEIMSDYLPLGTGPGTFGSQMSLQYTHIYDKYGVGAIMLGYDDTKGPIYDIFLISFTVEMGLGVLIFLYLSFMLLRINVFLSYYVRELKFIKVFLLTIMFIMSFIVPVYMNNFGFIIFAFIGMMLPYNLNKSIEKPKG